MNRTIKNSIATLAGFALACLLLYFVRRPTVVEVKVVPAQAGEAPPLPSKTSPSPLDRSVPTAGYSSSVVKTIYTSMLQTIRAELPPAELVARLKSLGLVSSEVRDGEELDDVHWEVRGPIPGLGIRLLSVLFQSAVGSPLELTRAEIYIEPHPQAYQDAVSVFEEALGPGSKGTGELSGYQSWGLGRLQLWVERIDDPLPPLDLAPGTIAVTYEAVDEAENEEGIVVEPEAQKSN